MTLFSRRAVEGQVRQRQADQVQDPNQELPARLNFINVTLYIFCAVQLSIHKLQRHITTFCINLMRVVVISELEGCLGDIPPWNWTQGGRRLLEVSEKVSYFPLIVLEHTVLPLFTSLTDIVWNNGFRCLLRRCYRPAWWPSPGGRTGDRPECSQTQGTSPETQDDEMMI